MEVFCFQLIASLIITKSSALSGILDRSGTPDELYSLLVSAIWDSLWDMLWPMRYATSYQLFVSIDMFYHISYGQSYELWVVYSVCMICHMRCNMSYIAIWGNISTGDPIQLPICAYLDYLICFSKEGDISCWRRLTLIVEEERMIDMTFYVVILLWYEL